MKSESKYLYIYETMCIRKMFLGHLEVCCMLHKIKFVKKIPELS